MKKEASRLKEREFSVSKKAEEEESISILSKKSQTEKEEIEEMNESIEKKEYQRDKSDDFYRKFRQIKDELIDLKSSMTQRVEEEELKRHYISYQTRLLRLETFCDDLLNQMDEKDDKFRQIQENFHILTQTLQKKLRITLNLEEIESLDFLGISCYFYLIMSDYTLVFTVSTGTTTKTASISPAPKPAANCFGASQYGNIDQKE